MSIIKSKATYSLWVIALVLLSFHSFGQKKILDQTIAVVGSQEILQSDVQMQLNQYAKQGYSVDDQTKCIVLENLLFNKLLLDQAAKDSVTVTDDQVNDELTRRIQYFVQQIGSEEQLESYYHKSIAQIKEEFRSEIKNQMLEQKMQSQITSNINVSPADVKSFYHSIPKDSLPLIDSKVKVAQIVIYPKFTKAELKAAKDKLEGIRKRIMSGESFSNMAILYSEDPGSAVKGGELGFTPRAQLVPKFAAAAFSLKVGEVSPVIQTKYGFHIIKLIARRGDEINVRHILIKPKSNPSDLTKVKSKLDSVRKQILAGKINFDKAAQQFSDDETTKNNGGLILDAQTASAEIDMKQLDKNVFFAINKLNPGQISQPVPYKSPDGKNGYRIVKLLERTKPHKASLQQDYSYIEKAAFQKKKNQAINDWIADKLKTTYVSINKDYHSCNFVNPWLKAAQ